MKRRNLTVRINAHVTEIVLAGKRAVGVRYRKGGRDGAPVEVRAAKEVILSGGAVNSPQLLQVSGIGPAPLLHSLGIEVRHALPAWARPARSLRAALRRPGQGGRDHHERSHGLKLVGEVLKYAVARKGILALNPDPHLRILESPTAGRQLRLQLPSRRRVTRKACKSTLDDFPGMTIASWQQRPDSSGICPRALGRSVRASQSSSRITSVAESDRRVLLAA